MSTDNETLVATIQLLLGDLPVTDKRTILQSAFPDDLISVDADRAILMALIAQARRQIHEILMDQPRGDSGLGALAVKNLNERISSINRVMGQIQNMLG